MTKFGFPDFKEGIPNLTKGEYQGHATYVENGVSVPGHKLDGSDKDLVEAAKWFQRNNPGVIRKGNTIEIDNEIYTMHHLENGEGIVPVLQSLHTAMKNSTGESVAHSGGGTILRNFGKLLKFFNY